jgi:hypothetical protein
MINGVNDLSIMLYPFRDSPRRNRVSFYADVVDLKGVTTAAVVDFTVRDITDDDLYQETKPLFDISNDAAQKLFDKLYDLGFRQTDVGTAGHLKATEKHLEDMRKIAFDRLNKEQTIMHITNNDSAPRPDGWKG